MICVVNFCLYFSTYLTMISGTNYAKIALGASTSTAGLVTLLYILGLIFSTLVFGKFIDSINLKKALFIVMGLDVVVTFCYLVANSTHILLFLRVLTGVLFGIGTSICNTTISKIIPESKKGVGIGYYNMSVIISSAISPFFAIKFNASGLYKESFLLATTAFVVSVLAILFMNLKEIENSCTATKKEFRVSDFIEPKALPIATIVLIAGFSYGGVLAFLSLYTQSLNLSFAGSIYYPFYSVFALISVWVYGKLFDIKKENLAYMLSLLAFFISLILLSTASSSFDILASAFFLAFGWASSKSLAQTIAIKLSPENRVGLANSTFFIFVNLGIGISPYVLGLVEPIVGFSGVYQISALALILGAILYYLLVWKNFK